MLTCSSFSVEHSFSFLIPSFISVVDVVMPTFPKSNYPCVILVQNNVIEELCEGFVHIPDRAVVVSQPGKNTVRK